MKLIIDIPEDYVNDFKLQVALIGEDLKDSPSGMAKYVIAEGISLEEELENQKTGHWVEIDDYPHEDFECDCCGGQVYATEEPYEEYKYCPNCGAKMESEE